MTVTPPLTFHLRYTFGVCQVTDKYPDTADMSPLTKYGLERRKDQDVKFSPVPVGFVDFTGDFPTVAKRAEILNKAQHEKGWLIYFYYPDTGHEGWKAAHCEVCARNHEQRQKDAS